MKFFVLLMFSWLIINFRFEILNASYCLTNRKCTCVKKAIICNDVLLTQLPVFSETERAFVEYFDVRNNYISHIRRNFICESWKFLKVC